jgi:hypothetical protein
MHEITNTLVYPQLMISIPFTNITVDPTKMYVRFEVYDYSGQYTDISKNPDQVLINEIKMKLIRDYLAPSKNFYRLNFLHFKNFEYINTDLFAQTLKIECSDEGQVYCFEDFQPYICSGGYDLLVNYENDTESNCIKNCTQVDLEGNVHQYMRLPNIKKRQASNGLISNNLCTYECNSSMVDVCPTVNGNNIKAFKCNDSYYSFFYQC